MAALSGSYFLGHSGSKVNSTKYLVWFLWITVFVEMLASYVVIAYYSNYRIFSFIENTSFQNNYWLYNIYNVVGFSFLTLYFVSFLKNKIWHRIFALLTIALIIIPGLVIIFSPHFFEPPSRFVVLARTLLLFFSILLFYFELLSSNLLLSLQKFLPFYISVGVLVFTLCVAPLDILFHYFNISEGNDLFVKLRFDVLLYANIFMYVTFILGFLICSTKKKLF